MVDNCVEEEVQERIKGKRIMEKNPIEIMVISWGLNNRELMISLRA